MVYGGEARMDRERERGGGGGDNKDVCACVRARVCARVREYKRANEYLNVHYAPPMLFLCFSSWFIIIFLSDNTNISRHLFIII